jgi:hypothetical protein
METHTPDCAIELTGVGHVTCFGERYVAGVNAGGAGVADSTL